MARAAKKKDSTISQNAYALHRGCSRSSVQAAIKSGRLSKSLTKDAKGFAKIKSAKAADREWKARTQPKPNAPPDDDEGQRKLPDTEVNYTEARRRREIEHLRQSRLSTEREERDAAKERGDVVSKSEHTTRLAAEYTHIRTKLLGLPIRCKQRLQHLTAGDVDVITVLMREALEDLADGN